MKKRTVFISLIILLILGALLAVGSFLLNDYIHGDPKKLQQATEKVERYLITNKKYRNEDIQEIKGTYSYKSSYYGASVVFKNEPTRNYLYEIVNDDVIQIGHGGSSQDIPKHLEK